MEHLLTPDTGLIIWTICTFFGLVFILKKVAWKPLLGALEAREAGIKKAIDDAQVARTSAEELKVRYEKDLAQAQTQVQQMMSQAQQESRQLREKMLKEAEADAQKLAEQTKRQLAEEKEKILRDIRQEVVSLSVKAAEKLIRQSITKKVQDDVFSDVLKDLEKRAN